MYTLRFVVFWKHSITVLLVLIVLSLASTIVTSSAHAAETKVNDSCPMTQFLIVEKRSCEKKPPKKTQAQEYLPSHAILSIEIPKKESEEIQEPQLVSHTPQNLQVTPTGTLSATLLFEMVNSYRASIALPPFEQEANVCGVAESRREEIASEIYSNLPLHAGFYAKNLPYWATENMIYQNTEEEALQWWLNSPVHRSAIQGAYKYACGVCNGEVCNMVFTSYEPKIMVVPSQVAPTVTIPDAKAVEVKNEALLKLPTLNAGLAR